MRKYLICLAIFSLIASCSCSKEEVMGPTEMWGQAVKFDPKIELVFIADTPEGRARRVLCSHYRKEGCAPGSGKRIKVRLVELLVIEYEHVTQACLAAQDIGQWYAYNWLFDDVTNEPVLQDFVVKAFGAKQPKTTKDCEF